MTFDPSDPIGSTFAGVIGNPAWNVRKGHGSFLTFEFGNPSLEVREPIKARHASRRDAEALARRRVHVHGEWHLWIYCCHWQATRGKEFFAHSGSPASEIEAAADMLDGQKLVSVVAVPEKGASRFTFDLGGILKTAPYRGNADENWMLFTPDDNVLSYRGDGRYSWQASHAPVGQETWHPLPAGSALN